MVSMLRILWSSGGRFHASPKHCSVTISSKRRRKSEALFSASSAPALPNICRRSASPAVSSSLSMSSVLQYWCGRCTDCNERAGAVATRAFRIARESQPFACQAEQWQVEREVIAEIGGDAYILGQQAKREARGVTPGNHMLARDQLGHEAAPGGSIEHIHH